MEKYTKTMLTQAVILAGGKGSRLGRLTRETPKPMLTVGGRPFLEYVVWNLKRHGIIDLLFSVGYLHERIVEYFGDGSGFGVHIEYNVEDKPAGTGGALKLAKEKLNPIFLVLNGDTLMDINYLDLALAFHQTDALASIALRRTPGDVCRYGSVLLEGERIKAFLEKSDSGPGIVNGGVYVMRCEAIDYLSSGTSSLEQDLFPVLADQGQLCGKVFEGFFIDIGVPESLSKAELELPAWQRKIEAAGVRIFKAETC